MPRHLAALSLLAVIIALSCKTLYAEQSGSLQTVDRFAKLLLQGEGDDWVEMLDAQVKRGLPPHVFRRLFAKLAGHHGTLLEVGPAYAEDVVGAHRRFRVPIDYDKEDLDLRVVLDEQDLVAGLFFVPHVEPPAAEEAKAPVTEIEVVIGKGDESLGGTLSLPEGDGPFPGVVLVHGSGPSDRDETVGRNKPFRDLAWGLATRGVAVLRYDKRSFARPASLQPHLLTLTVKEETIDDAVAALKLLAGRDEIDASRVFVAGHSLGGMVAPRIAAAAEVAGTIVLAGSTLPLHEKIVTQTDYIIAVDGVVTEEEKAHAQLVKKQMAEISTALAGEGDAPKGMIMGAPFAYWKDLAKCAPAAEAAGQKRPILVLQGERDYQVTMEDLAVWQQALEGKAFATLKSYPKLDHLLREGEGASTPEDYATPAPVAEELIEDVARWVQDAAARK